MRKDLDKIKKLYGEDFAKKICRKYFSHILEREDFSFAEFLKSHFYPSKFLYEDLIKYDKATHFKNAIYGMLNNSNTVDVDIKESPEKLMKMAGYKLYKCETNEDIFKFKKYYKPDEALCTFNDPARIQTHTIFWAVKDNVNKIKREDFPNPRRQDEYGTSVISIQFTKGIESTLSIKNRYNHKVEFPDATFSNDLENIQAGLTDSFKKFYNIQLVNSGHSFNIPGYVVDNSGCLHKSLYEIENVHYCANNIIVHNGKAMHYDPARYIIMDYFIVDRKDKTIKLFKQGNIYDSFIEQFKETKKIDAELDGENTLVTVTSQNGNLVKIILNKYNQIISFENNNVEAIGLDFMRYCSAVKDVTLDKVTEIGNGFLADNLTLEKLNADNLELIGDDALRANISMKTLELNKLKRVGDMCLVVNESLTNVELKKLEKVGKYFMATNKKIEEIKLPKLIEIDEYFMQKNTEMENFYAPQLEKKRYGKFLNKHLLEIKKETLFSKILQRLKANKKDELDILNMLYFD